MYVIVTLFAYKYYYILLTILKNKSILAPPQSEVYDSWYLYDGSWTWSVNWLFGLIDGGHGFQNEKIKKALSIMSERQRVWIRLLFSCVLKSYGPHNQTIKPVNRLCSRAII